MYFLRLAGLKPAVEKIAAEAWDGFSVCTSARTMLSFVLNKANGSLVLVIRLPENVLLAWNEYSMCDRASCAGLPVPCTWTCR